MVIFNDSKVSSKLVAIQPDPNFFCDEARRRIDKLDISEAEKKIRIDTIVALACAARNCSAGVPDADPLKEYLVGLESNGEIYSKLGYSLADEMAKLDLEIHRSTGGRTPNLISAFEYSADDAIADVTSRHTSHRFEFLEFLSDNLLKTTSWVVTEELASGSHSEHLRGFSNAFLLDVVEDWQDGFIPGAGQRVVDSFSLHTYEGERNFLTDVALLGVDVVPALKPIGAADKFSDAASYAKHLDNIIDDVDVFDINPDLLKMPWESLDNTIYHSDFDHFGLGFGGYDGNGYGLNANSILNDDAVRVSSRPEWLRRIDEGNEFNRVQAPKYDYSEVYVNKPDGNGYFRLDSYNPSTNEIISRKFTQFSDIQESTAFRYINEIQKKYPVGASIADVPTNVQNGLVGQRLQGQYVLEVPVQNKPIPQSVIDAANDASVIIRDTDGKIY